MFIYHDAHTWTLELKKLASLGSGDEWKTPPFYPLEFSERMALCFNNSGGFRLELLHRADQISKAIPSYDHVLKHRTLKNATCEVWSADRTECYHSHRFVLNAQDDLRLAWNVPKLSQWSILSNANETTCLVTFRVNLNSQYEQSESAYRRVVDAQFAEKEATQARIARQECQEKHQATLKRLCRKTEQRSQAIYSTSHPFNVRFAFGPAGDLWENSEFLASQSGHFAGLFAAEFSESVMKPGDHEHCSVPTRTVHVTQASLEEYRAVFVWLRTGLILFDDSTGDSELSDIEAIAPRSNVIQASSIYSLSHYLQLPELSALALNFCLEHLTPAQAAVELFREWCYPHQEVRQKLIEYVVRNWSEVKKSSVITELCKTTGKDSDLPFETQNVLLELMAKVAIM